MTDEGKKSVEESEKDLVTLMYKKAGLTEPAITKLLDNGFDRVEIVGYLTKEDCVTFQITDDLFAPLMRLCQVEQEKRDEELKQKKAVEHAEGKKKKQWLLFESKFLFRQGNFKASRLYLSDGDTVLLKSQTGRKNTALLQKEAKRFQGIDHPNVARVIDNQLHPSTESFCELQSFVVYQFGTRCSILLQEKIQESGRSYSFWSWLQRLNTLNYIVAGLRAFEQSGGLHHLTTRDIVLQSNGSVLLVGGDFAHDSKFQHYAPEMLKTGADPSFADSWAVGMIIYEMMILGTLIPDPAHPIEFVRKRSAGERPHIPLYGEATWAERISEKSFRRMSSLVQQCWEVTPQKRPKLEQLERSIRDEIHQAFVE